MREEKGKYEGFLFNLEIYTVAIFMAYAIPYVARIILSAFIKTPGIAELRADASVLFNFVYPVAAVVTIAAFLLGGYFTCGFAAYKVAFKTKKGQDSKKAAIQIITSGTIVYLWVIWSTIYAGFQGLLGFFFWYPGAIAAPFLGLVDKTNVLNVVGNYDISITNFIITGLTEKIIGLILLFSVVIAAAFVYVCILGRRHGERAGVSAAEKLSAEIRGTHPGE